MKIDRTCKICGNHFVAIKRTQFFCNRKCFKREYYVRSKNKEGDKAKNPSYPIKKCSFCEERSSLTFDPMKARDKFDGWECPHCHVSNKLVWEHQKSPNSYQIIKDIMITYQSPSFSLEVSILTPVEQYRLPVARLEHANNKKLLLLACESMDLIKTQKNGRKKILFS